MGQTLAQPLILLNSDPRGLHTSHTNYYTPSKIPHLVISGNSQAFALQDNVLFILSSDSTAPSTRIFQSSHHLLHAGNLTEGVESNKIPSPLNVPQDKSHQVSARSFLWKH